MEHMGEHKVHGKYCISSINRIQYYVIFVNDHGRFTSLDFTKTKEEAIQSVKLSTIPTLTNLMSRGILLSTVTMIKYMPSPQEMNTTVSKKRRPHMIGLNGNVLWILN